MQHGWYEGRNGHGGSGQNGRGSTKTEGRSGGDDEREFFDERTEVKTHNLTCPNCQQVADYALTWLVRRKRARLTGYSDAAKEARFAKARSYMVRRDDLVACQNIRCRKRFEIAGVQSVAFLENSASGSVEDRAARVRAAFAKR